MKNGKLIFAVCALAAFNSAHAAPLPLVWRAEWPDAKVEQRSVHRGTDVALAPQWIINGRPADTNGWTFSTCVSTNGADWLEVPGLVFSHTNDCGAAQYLLMVRAFDGGSVNYTANVRLRMLASPGFTPAEVEWPVKRLDFAAVEVLNDPWTEAIESNRVNIASKADKSTTYTKAETDAAVSTRFGGPEAYESFKAFVEGDNKGFYKDGAVFLLPPGQGANAGGVLAKTSDIPPPYTPSAADPAFSNAVVAVTTNEIRREVSAAMNTYVDGETGVEYVGKFYGGNLYYVPTGNVYPKNN